MKRTSQQLVDEAMARIETISAEDAIPLHGREDVIFVDIRDPRELARVGKVPDAVHAPRGMLEFWIDPESPYHKDVFSRDARFVFFCAGGLRSALATDVAQTLGLTSVCHIGGGFGAWKEAGGPMDPPSDA